MDFRKIAWIRGALAVVLALSGPLTAGAQGPPGGVTEPYTPAKDDKDLKAVLFNWMRNMGVLKGHDERDMVAMLEYQGKGTIQVDGQPCTLTKYRASTNYQTVEDPEVLVEPGCCPHERCGATQIPTRAFSENGATARCTNSTTSPHRSATSRCDCDFAICYGMTRWRLP